MAMGAPMAPLGCNAIGTTPIPLDHHWRHLMAPLVQIDTSPILSDTLAKLTSSSTFGFCTIT
jgi:hypothetical protein